MIIVNLKGGLGNQMFQYTCGRALSLRMEERGEDSTLKLDTTGFTRMAKNDTRRTLGLDAFRIAGTIASEDEVRKIKYPLGIISKGLRFFNAKALRRFNVHFIPEILELKGTVYLDGFFQSEQYFKHIEEIVREDFRLKDPFSEEAQAWFDKMSHDPYAIALHVRRGDYVSDKTTEAYWNVCDKAYYEQAVALLAEYVNKPNIYVFSDDITWAKENLTFPYPASFVSSPLMSPAEELTLMGACRHNIIANSTFSWWGAWLNPHSEKKVIAPKVWAKKHTEDWYKDIIPESWIRI